MNTAARLLATQLVEAEPEPEQNPELPEPTPPAAPGFDVKDWIVGQELVHAGQPDPSYYQRLEDQLGNRTKKKLEYETYLLRLDDGSIVVRLHTTNIITARPDGVVIVSTYGTPNPKQMYSRERFGYVRQGYGETARSWRTPFTRNRMEPWLPCGWNIYAHGKSSLPSATSMAGGKRGDQNWWWANQHSRSGLWDGPGSRIPFSDYDQIDTKTGELKSRLPPVPVQGRGSNPERTSGYGFNDKFYEAKKLAPAWTETGGVFGDFSGWPKVEYYAKCPKCGHVHGSYNTMREAHSKRLCQLCDLERVERIKDAVAHVDDPGVDAKKVLRMVGETEEFDVRGHILGYGAEDWVFRAKQQLEDEESMTLQFVDDTVPDQEPGDVAKFELESPEEGNWRRYWVFKDDDTAVAHAVDMVANDLQNEPEIFTQAWLIDYVDKDKLRQALAPEDSYLEHEDLTEQVAQLIRGGFLEEDRFYTATGKFRKITPKLQRLIDDALDQFKEKERKNFDPLDHLRDIYGKDEWMKQALEFAPLSREKMAEAAKSAVSTDGWPHFVARYDGHSIDLEGGAVAARTN